MDEESFQLPSVGSPHFDEELGIFIIDEYGRWLLNAILDVYFQNNVETRFICISANEDGLASLKDNIRFLRPLLGGVWNQIAGAINGIIESKHIDVPNEFILVQMCFLLPDDLVSQAEWEIRLMIKDMPGEVVARFWGIQLIEADFLTYEELATKSEFGEADFSPALACGEAGHIPLEVIWESEVPSNAKHIFCEFVDLWPQIWPKVEESLNDLLNDYDRTRSLSALDTTIGVILPSVSFQAGNEWLLSIRFKPEDGTWCIDFDGLEIIDSGVAF